MAILKEFACAAHGPFEAFVKQDEIAKCPKGCSTKFVVREIRTAVATQNVITGRLDSMQKDIAHSYGLRDIKVDKQDGSSVMENLRKGEKPSDFSPYWASNPDISAFKPTDVMKNAKFDQPSPGVVMGSHRGVLPEV
jgi:hypothetical protein